MLSKGLKMKVSHLSAGMLLKPITGYCWVELPWRGTEGVIIGHYLSAIKEGSCVVCRIEPTLYLGTTSQSAVTASTPGSQVVLAWGNKMTIDPHSWRNIEPHT